MRGARSKEWLKIKANKRHEVVIGGIQSMKILQVIQCVAGGRI